MKKLLPLLAVLAVPAQAQDSRVYYASDTWPVHVAGRACTMVQAGAGDNALSVSYDGNALTLTTTNLLASPLQSDSAELGIVFLQNAGDAYDFGWGSRRFALSRDGAVHRFSTGFAGEGNVRQLLSDLAASEAIGFTYRGQPMISYELGDADRSLAQLRECASRAVAAN